MAQLNFDVFTQNAPQAKGATQPQVDTNFKLAAGEKAIVRFLHDDTASFDIVSTHSVQVAGRSFKQRVSCLRGDHDPVDACPLCAAGMKQENRIYVHLLQYTMQQDGTVLVEPKIWERPIAFAYELRDKITDYGPLSQQVFIIKRTGTGASDTRYTVDYAVPAVYPPERFPLQPELMEQIKYKHPYLMNRNAEQMAAFLATGVFPELQQEAPAQEIPVQQAPVQPTYVAPTPAYTAPTPTVQGGFTSDPLPSGYANVTMEAPVRQAPFTAGGQQAPIRRYE